MPRRHWQAAEHGDWDGLPLVPAETEEARTTDLPDFLLHPALAYVPPAPTLSPSDLGGAKALPGDMGLDEEAAKLRGTRIHLLLEHLPALPRDAWQDAAERLIGETEDLPDLLAEAAQVIDAPALAQIFAPDTLAEVPVSADLGDQRLHGVIDRLIVAPDRVLAVDFKTNATVPDNPAATPIGLLRQMGAYAHALAAIWPDRKIETAILWTRTATLMPLPHDLVSEAVSLLDDTSGRT